MIITLLIGILGSIIAAIIIAVIRKLYIQYKNKNVFISKIDLESTPFFKNSSFFFFEKVNYFYGPNSSGKSALSEWISTLEDDSKINRWLKEETSLPINFSIYINSIKNPKVRITIEKDGVNYYLGEIKSIVSPIPFKFVFLKEKWIQNDNCDAITYIAKKLSITDTYLQKLIDQFNSHETLSIHGLKIFKRESKRELSVKLNKKRPYMNFYSLSGSEQQRVIIELGIKFCSYLSISNPTFLIIEQSSFDIDKEYFAFVIEKLTTKSFQFQTLIIGVEKPYIKEMNNYKSLVFTGKVPNIELVEV